MKTENIWKTSFEGINLQKRIIGFFGEFFSFLKFLIPLLCMMKKEITLIP